MRRSAPVLILWCLLSTMAFAIPAASAEEPPSGAAAAAAAGLPAGFTDGEPVGGTAKPAANVPLAPSTGPPASQSKTTASTTASRYFGDGPWLAIAEASNNTTRCSSLTGPDLTAMVVAPIFKESSAATTASTAPAPMTLSRWDEWSGTKSTTTNQNANHTLYAFANPHTAYPRAFWHPGIGIWQYDSAGVGAPYTAIERMDVRVVAKDVAAGMASRFCNPPTAVVGHGAPFTIQERRNAAWWPWWTASTTRSCPLCQAEYDKMTASTPYFGNVSLVAGIAATGGAVKRTCTLPGVIGTVECWYVKPAVGVIQGATGWATAAIDGRNDPTVAPTPLSAPFYVIKRNGHEERHWLKADSGYATDISGRRMLGKNERVRSNQTGSGVTWNAASGLCDQTTSRGSCPPVPPVVTVPVPPVVTVPVPPVAAVPNPVPAPAGIKSAVASVGGTYRPVSLDFNGDRKGDILWYAPGAATDSLWRGEGSGRFTQLKTNIGGTFDEVHPLDFNGDGRDDLVFYQPSSGLAYVWQSKGDGTFVSIQVAPGAGRRPVIGDYDANGRDDIFWYGSGPIGDSMWTWTGTAFKGQATTVDGVFRPLVGDFDGNGRDDIFWYGPGAAADRLWLHAGSGARVSKAVSVGANYTPLVGDFNGDGLDDIFWYSPGTTGDHSWFATGAGSFTSTPVILNDTYRPLVVDLGGDGRDDIVWHRPTGTDSLWTRWSAGRARSSVALRTSASHQAITGALSANGGDGIFWYANGPTAESIWYR